MTTYGDRYRVIERLGSGAAATVYLAEDEQLGRRVALKRMRSETSDDDAERFRREAQLAASLNHPNVVRVYDTLSDEDDTLIVMEYVDGVDLGERLAEGAVPPQLTVSILRDAAAGLDHAHAQGLIHRDVKPQNILLGNKGQVKLTDLGIAKATEGTHLTSSDMFLGTPQYMAPEQIEGKPVTAAADVYSLAMIAFQMLSGQSPRGGGSIPVVAHRAVNEPAPDIREAWPEASQELHKVMCRALDRDPGARPQRAGEFVSGLEAALGGTSAAATQIAPATAPAPVAVPEPEPEPVTPVVEEPAVRPEPPPPTAPAARPAPAQPDRRPWLGRALAGLALLAVAVIIVLIATGGDDSPEPSSSGQSAGAQQGEGEESGAPDGDGGGEEATPDSGGETSTEGGGDTGAQEDNQVVDDDPPSQAVVGFYEAAAANDFATARELSTDTLENELSPLEGTFATLESIEFTSLETVSSEGSSAQVDYSTVATHEDFTDTCTASADVVSVEGTWQVDNLLAVDCDRS